jgi:tetratricopeptide (TPR) repeat protein
VAVGALFLSAGALAAEATQPAPSSGGLDVWRRAVEQGVVNFALEPLQKLHADPDRPDWDEVALLFARSLFLQGEHDRAAGVLEGHERTFPPDSRFLLDAAYWLARADLERSRAAGTAEEAAKLLARARLGLTRVLDGSVAPRLLEGARYFLGVTLFEEGDYGRALATFRRARELGAPASEAEALDLHVGRAHLELRSFEEAGRVFARFADRSPSNPAIAEALYGLGEAHYYLEEWADAASAYGRARDAASRGGDAAAAARARYAHGWALMKLGEQRSRAGETDDARAAWEEALPEFEALATHPDRTLRNASVFESGEILYRLGRPAEAAERLLRLTDPARYPGYAAKALYVSGRSHAELGNLSVAVKAFERALDAGAEGDLARRVRRALAEALVAGGEPERALGALSRLARSGESASVRAAARLEMALLVCRAGELAAGRGEARAAASYYSGAFEALGALARNEEALAELQADRVVYWRARAADRLSRLAEGDEAGRWSDDAIEAYKEVRKRAGWNEWAERSLADQAALHVFRGELKEAAKLCRDLLEHGDVTPAVELETRLRLADIEFTLGGPHEARRALGPVLTEERLAAGRDEAEYKSALAFSLERGGSEAAMRGYRALIDRSPEGEWTPFARAGLGARLAAAGRHAEAAEQYETILLDSPAYPDRDEVELAAGDARRLAGSPDAAVAHYRSLFRRGRSDDLRARARLAEAGILLDAGRAADALDLARDGAETARSGSVSREAEELRGRLLLALGRHEGAALAFARAGRGAEGEFLARVRSGEARALLEWARAGLRRADPRGQSPYAAFRGASAPQAGAPAEPDDVLRRAARKFTEAHYLAAEGALRDESALSAAGALVELAAAERANGHADTAAAELREARRLVDLVSPELAERKRRRIREIEDAFLRPGGRR